MPYNPNIHHRKSIRLKGYDYAQAGLYFITICTQNRACLFGEIRRGEPTCSPEIQSCSPEIQSCSPEMILNGAGNMIAKWYIELENKFADIRCHEMIVMPNHFHCIVEIVGADLRVCPDDKPVLDKSETDKPVLDKSETDEPVSDNSETDKPVSDKPETDKPVSDKPETDKPVSDKPETDEPVSDKSETDKPVLDLLGEHIGSPLHRVVQWFKTMSTNEYIRGVKTLHWQPFDGKLWQRNYWEHIIRNENEYKRITEYIINNPKNWGNDTLKK